MRTRNIIRLRPSSATGNRHAPRNGSSTSVHREYLPSDPQAIMQSDWAEREIRSRPATPRNGLHVVHAMSGRRANDGNHRNTDHRPGHNDSRRRKGHESSTGSLIAALFALVALACIGLVCSTVW